MGQHDHPDRKLHASNQSIHGDNFDVVPNDAESAAAATAGQLGNTAPGTPTNAPGAQTDPQLQTDTQLKTRTEQAQRTTAKPTSMRSKKRNQPSETK